MFPSEPAGSASFVQHAAWFDAVHPVWYALASDGMSIRTLADDDDPVLLDAAHQHGVAVIPTVASVDDTSFTKAMLEDSNRRAQHVRALVDLAVAHGYDGLDLDYEHLWDAADAAPLSAFLHAFADAMHGAGKVVSVAAPALDGPSPVWDYHDLASVLDQVHLMGYDFHFAGGSHAGPTAPLGWVDAVGSYVASASGAPARFLLGLPNYGVSASAVCDLNACASQCTTPVVVGTNEMTTCPDNPRGYQPGRVLDCQSAAGPVFFDDATSLAEKAASARAHGLGGLTYWKIGGEPSGFFEALGQ